MTPLTRALTSAALVPYHGLMSVRNALYDRQILPSYPLGRWTISVGNLSFGGTGKTPVVIWLAEKLRSRGHHPAVLLRGYKSRNGISDEATLLSDRLPNIPVIPNPNRIAGATDALKKSPNTDIFILDDALQHRRARRDVEITLINATQSPRTLLREALSGLRRSTAILITHASENPHLPDLEETLRRHNPSAPILHCDHAHTGLLDPSHRHTPMGALALSPFVVACAIADPASFLAALARQNLKPAATRVFPDHHPFTPDSAANLQAWAASQNASAIVVTEKDWTKLSPFPAPIPILRVRLALRFRPGDEEILLNLATPES